MVSASPVRAVFIGLTFALMILPAMEYYRTPPEWTVMGLLRTIFPALLVLFGQLCLAQGRARERATRDKTAAHT